MEGDVVYPGISRVMYPRFPVPCTDFPPNIPDAQQFNQDCSGHLLGVSPFYLHPLLAPPSFPFFLPSPCPTMPASPSLTQAYIDQYAPMVQRQLSFNAPEAAGNCWQQQVQRSHLSVLLPPPSSSPAPLDGNLLTSQWNTPTILSPAALATLLGPADGMSTNKLDEMPAFFIGEVLDDRKNNCEASDAPHRRRAVSTPTPQQHIEHHEKQLLHHRQCNASSYTYYSEASPPQLTSPAEAYGVRVQSCPAPLLLESPFMPMAGNLADLDGRGNLHHQHPRRRRSSDSKDEEPDAKTSAGAAAGGGNGSGGCDPLEGMDIELLYRYFGGGYAGNGAGPGSSAGTKTTATATVVETKHKDSTTTPIIQQLEHNAQRDYTQNMDLQILFQHFVDDLEALPPLNLAELGKPAAEGQMPSPPHHPTTYYGYTYTTREEYLSPMSPIGHYHSVVNNKKRGAVPVEEVYNPHTPEKVNISLSRGPRKGGNNYRYRPVLERETSSTTPTPTPAAISPQHRFRVESSAGVSHSEVLAMLPCAAKRRRSSSVLKNKIAEKVEGDRDKDDEEEDYTTSPSSKLPTRCVYLFGKTITPSDAGKLARIVLPRAAVERHFPPCEHKSGVPLTLWDQHGNSYGVLLKFWMNGRPVAKRMWLLDQCQELIEVLGLEAGSLLNFYKADDGRFVVKSN